MNTTTDNPVTTEAAPDEDVLEPLVSLASALMDIDRLRIAGKLAQGPANRMHLNEATGVSHRELLRHLNLLQYFGLVRLVEPAPRNPDHYSLYELNQEAFRAARQAMGKLRGRKPRPTDARLMTLETFMPGGKLSAFPKKQEQILVLMDEIARKFEPDREYKEKEVNVILEDVNEDYCTIRRILVDYGYLSRHKGIYTKNA
jgi:ArsR family transcriptional regulator